MAQDSPGWRKTASNMTPRSPETTPRRIRGHPLKTPPKGQTVTSANEWVVHSRCFASRRFPSPIAQRSP
eukprot:9500947-Pyramimonas_sp.AAC.1